MTTKIIPKIYFSISGRGRLQEWERKEGLDKGGIMVVDGSPAARCSTHRQQGSLKEFTAMAGTKDLCPACGKKLPSEGALRADRQQPWEKNGKRGFKIVSLHHECAAADPKRFSKDLFAR